MLAAEPAAATAAPTMGSTVETFDSNESEEAHTPTTPGVIRRSTPDSPTEVVGFPEIRGPTPGR